MEKFFTLDLSQKIINYEKEEVPVLIGTLNKKMGWNNYLPAEIGTEVYEFKNLYQFTIFSENNVLSPHIVRFYKETLSNSINF
jgi:hypothetical protein